MNNEFVEDVKNSDDALFHYTKTSIAIEHILPRQELKLSLPKETNDPRENKEKIFSLSCKGLPENSTDRISKQAYQIINKILLSESKMLCFCSNKKPTLILNDGNTIADELNCSDGYNKSRMWSQYGENHRGICLVFSKEKLEKELETKRHRQILDYKCGYVQYFEEGRMPLKITKIDGNKFIKENEDYLRRRVIENSDEFFYRKHIDYRDEAEYRIVVFDPDGNLKHLNINSSIRGVIAGDATPKVYFRLINELSEQFKIKPWKVGWSRSNGTWYFGPLIEKY
jgi:hypothetical protein